MAQKYQTETPETTIAASRWLLCCDGTDGEKEFAISLVAV